MKKMSICAGNGWEAPASLLILRNVEEDRVGFSPRCRYRLLGAELYHGSLTQLKAVNACLSSAEKVIVDGDTVKLYSTYGDDGKLEVKLARIRDGYETVHMSCVTTKALEKVLFGVNEEDFHEGLYEYLMRTTDLPLKKEWMGYLFDRFTERELLTESVVVLAANDNMQFSYGGRTYKCSQLRGYNIRYSLNEFTVLSYLQDGIKNGRISLTPSGSCMNPMILTDLDTYRLQYGEEFVSNVKKLIKPYYGRKGGVEECFLSGKKRLYKQQGAIVNAAADNFFHHRENTQWLIEQMGSGKSIQAIATMEETASLRYLATNPGKTPEEAHEKEGNLNYRAIIMPPGHLVNKWAKEIKENIPYANVKILESLKDCAEIKAKGMKRNGKEFYIIGKDLAKLGCTEMPTPTKVIKSFKSRFECRCCKSDFSAIRANELIESRQPCKCGKNPKPFKSLADFRETKVRELKPLEGLQCPSCGRLLLSDKGEPLMPWNFMNRTQSNDHCSYCGETLWKPLVRNVGGEPRKDGWHKVSFFKNHTKKATETGWVLSGYEDVTYLNNGIIVDGIKDSTPVVLRKWPPARYIKEQLAGFFDFAVFDELHEYKGAGTAQSIAMHAVAKASKQTIGLTGTIAGGYASDLFYTTWRLAPHIMVENGFEFEGEKGEKAFVAKYGTLETKYENTGDGSVNRMSRGKKLGETRTKPGISPDIFGDILMPITLFLDLTDMSNKLPELHESVVSVDMDADVDRAYTHSLDRIKMAAGQGNFLSSLSSEMLVFSLLYPDMPMAYKDKIIDSKNGRCVEEPEKFPVDRVYPKEEKMIEILNKELDEGRRCFVYCEYTNSGLTERLKKLICDYCGLEDKEVAILKSESPSAAKREEWIHKKASEGVKVVITNPKNVETGLDFIFEYEGVTYNYPTLVFYECGTSLFTLWQASRRSYRLNQTKECRTYYLCYAGTNQAKIIRLMAEKQVATSSIQGKFSMEGLQAMAQSVDPRLILMQSLMGAAEDANEDAEKAAGIFANLNEATGIDESIYGPSETRLYKEVYGRVPEGDTDEATTLESLLNIPVAASVEEPKAEEPEAENTAEAVAVVESSVSVSDGLTAEGQALLNSFFVGFAVSEETKKEVAEAAEVIKRKNKKKIDDAQMSLADFFTMIA
jgi:hypothetical protein